MDSRVFHEVDYSFEVLPCRKIRNEQLLAIISCTLPICHLARPLYLVVLGGAGQQIFYNSFCKRADALILLRTILLCYRLYITRIVPFIAVKLKISWRLAVQQNSSQREEHIVGNK